MPQLIPSKISTNLSPKIGTYYYVAMEVQL